MTIQEINIVKRTWKLLRDVDPQLLGDVFYRRLFLTYPSVRPMFREPMTTQYHKFVDMLSLIVSRIDRPEEVMSEIAQLAQRHERYGVKPEHYPVVGETLLWTLEQGLGNQWNNDVKQAWEACYQTLVQAMLEKA
ncbi:hemoglobin [Fibrisoma limi BUZ 3]|uniref:Hemoglobin n=1 Tax=Fibrisoma limi BUZ 3 TaxID=1185876 RepID=I2GB73_9BACT|nr:globin domain-containing protein [Fibrisoma limi]CCH51147.1 hemoglobin [Fibrisoma limi BUZ 3]